MAQAWRARTNWGEELELTVFPRFLRTPNVKTRDLSIVVHGRGARTDACGRSFAVLSTQVSKVGSRLRLVVPRSMPAAVASRCCRRRFQQLLRLRHSKLACGSMLEVSREAVAAEEEHLASCEVEQSGYSSICTVALGPCGDLPFTSWGRWKCLHGGADLSFNSCYAFCGCGVSRLVAMVCIWCTRSLRRLNSLDLLLRHNALVGGHPGPRKRQMNILLLVDTTIEGASPSHARQE